jgi:hypothetical protein
VVFQLGFVANKLPRPSIPALDRRLRNTAIFTRLHYLNIMNAP